MTYKGDIPILVNYQGAHDSNFPSFPLGTEYSHNYSSDKGVFFYAYNDSLATAIGFKAFLRSFTINFQFAKNEIKTRVGTIEQVKSVGLTYKFGFDLPAISVNDARVNAARLDTFSLFIGKTITGVNAIGTEELNYYLLGNLINNGKYNKQLDIKTADDIKKYAVQGFMKNFSYEIDTEMGFFEHVGKLWPKNYNFDLELTAKPKIDTTDTDGVEKKLFDSFQADGSISSDELNAFGSFPFGVNI